MPPLVIDHLKEDYLGNRSFLSRNLMLRDKVCELYVYWKKNAIFNCSFIIIPILKQMTPPSIYSLALPMTRKLRLLMYTYIHEFQALSLIFTFPQAKYISSFSVINACDYMNNKYVNPKYLFFFLSIYLFINIGIH